jgi:hypothetical protein
LRKRLLHNGLIIVRNYRDDEEDIQDTKDMLEIPRDIHNKVGSNQFGIPEFDFKSNLESRITFPSN